MTRPRFTEREGRLLLSAIYRMARDEGPDDTEVAQLHRKLDRTWGDNRSVTSRAREEGADTR